MYFLVRWVIGVGGYWMSQQWVGQYRLYLKDQWQS